MAEHSFMREKDPVSIRIPRDGFYQCGCCPDEDKCDDPCAALKFADETYRKKRLEEIARGH